MRPQRLIAPCWRSEAACNSPLSPCVDPPKKMRLSPLPFFTHGARSFDAGPADSRYSMVKTRTTDAVWAGTLESVT
jgi:hypothetical protein